MPVSMGFFSAKCMSAERLDGKTAVITGCNTGIGKETAKDLFQRGARVIMACRNLEKADAARSQIESECAGSKDAGELKTVQLDLSSLKSIRSCAAKLLDEEHVINLLINNAGIMACPLLRTEDNFEMQFGTNHLGHFLFTLLLIPKIKNSTPARIVTLSSKLHNGVLDFEDLNYDVRNYSAYNAYKQSKLANILFTKELSRKLEGAKIKGITTYCLHPGVIKSELNRHLDTTYFKGASFLMSLFNVFYKTPKQGAQTTIYCAVSEEAGKETGLYYAGCRPTKCASQAHNVQSAEILWEESSKLVGLDDNYDPFQSETH